MILRLKPSLPHHGTFAVAAPVSPVTFVPSWLRRAVPDAQNLAGNEIEDVALVGGASIGALDAVLGEFGYAPDGAAVSGLADELRQPAPASEWSGC